MANCDWSYFVTKTGLLFLSFHRVATGTVNWLWNSRIFPGLFRTFSSKFKDLRTKKALVILYINSAMSFTRPASGEKSSLRFSFYTLLHQWYYVRLWQTVHFDYYLQLKVKLFAHSRISKDRNPNSRTFQGLEFSFANSRTFQDFQGP